MTANLNDVELAVLGYIQQDTTVEPPHAVTNKGMSEALKIDRDKVSRAATKLAAKGLVTRMTFTDRTVGYVRLTDEVTEPQPESVELEFVLVNGDFAVHAAGCRDMNRIIKSRKTDYSEPGRMTATDERDAVTQLWEDQIGDNYSDPAEMPEAEWGVYEGATDFAPCVKFPGQPAKAKAAPAKARKSEDLLRPATKTVSAYVAWLNAQISDEDWAALVADPIRLAEVSLQNYGRYQATVRKAER